MGVNNRQRRATKRRKASRARGNGGPSRRSYDRIDQGALQRELIATALHRLVASTGVDPGGVREAAEQMLGPDVAVQLIAEEMGALLADLVATAMRAGWAPSDLGEIVHRRLTGRHLPVLAGLLHAEADRHPPHLVAAEWRADLADLGRSCRIDQGTVGGLELALGLAGLIASLPAIGLLLPPPGQRAEASQEPVARAQGRQLAKVRALLAKAESTEFDEEAEALSAKAQQLISRYALDRLVAEGPHETTARAMAARRLWIDAPYVFAKAILVDAVAGANRCRSVVSEDLGFCTVVGDPSDLDAVELLTTSLLVQADTALLRHGRQADRSGTSRTRSFRRSFLIAYAARIGERLKLADDQAVAGTGGTRELVPLLAERRHRVDATIDGLFPHVQAKGTAITNGAGWVAGRAAADLALFDARGEVSP